jgi:hypothetical protein
MIWSRAMDQLAETEKLLGQSEPGLKARKPVLGMTLRRYNVTLHVLP